MHSSYSVEIILPDNNIKIVSCGRTLLEISKEVQDHYPSTIVAALVNNKLMELSGCIKESAQVRFLDLTTREGARIYQRSLTFLLIYSAHVLFPDATVKIEHSLGKGLYCEIVKDPALNGKDVEMLENKMCELVKKDIKISKRKVSKTDAKKVFKKQGYTDKVHLLDDYQKDTLSLYSIEDLEDTLYGYHIPSTGYLKVFALQYYKPGLILRFPDQQYPSALPPFVQHPKLFGIFREAERWGEILGFDTVGDMNRLIKEGNGPEAIRITEALHEKKISQIADLITERNNEIRIIMIAGPTSSGKTTFAQRLRIQLLVNGISPYLISLDDYFVDHAKTPLDEANKPDFEHIETIDLPLFNEHLLRLLAGDEVEIPTFNFTNGLREYNGKSIKLEKNQPLIIEGIHGLNERLTYSIPRDQKFKIYISALTSLNIDRHTRIHTTDTRLLRRIVRDIQFRGTDALTNIRRWPSVRRGEECNIFFLQEEADIMFNSSLAYEVAVLKQFAEELLEKICDTEPEYLHVKRLLTFLSFFISMKPDDNIPSNSILREFIGGSCFFGA